MKKETKRQIELLKKYGIDNYTVEGDKITINNGLYLANLESIPDSDFLKDTIIHGSLNLSGLKSTPDSDFLKYTIIHGSLNLSSLKSIHSSDFLKDTTISGNLCLDALESVPDSNFLKYTNINSDLYLNSLKSIPDSNFLKYTIINGDLDLDSLESIPDSDFLKYTIIDDSVYLSSLKSTPDNNFLKYTTIGGLIYAASLPAEERETIKKNVKPLNRGYNKEGGYCYFDGILSKVLSVKKTKGYTIYTTPFDIIAQKGDFTAHAKNAKQAILDLEFKIVQEKVKKEPIKADDLMTVEKYRAITGACDLGCRNFMQKHNIPFKVVEGITVEEEPMTSRDLMTLLEETRPYGYDKIKSLVTF